MTFDDEKYQSLRNTLKRAPKLKAKSDFEARLFERIRQTEKSQLHTEAFKHHPQVVKLAEPKKGFMEVLAGLFRPAFIPAVGLTVVLFVCVAVYFAYFNKMNDAGDQDSFSYQTPEDLIIYVKSSGADSFSSNYPKEYSAVTEGEFNTGSTERSYSPTNMPSDFFAPPPVEDIKQPIAPAVERDQPRMDKVSEEQRLEMEKGYDMEKGVDSKREGKNDGIMKKESKLSPKKESKTETPFNIRKNETINSQDDDESDDIIKQSTEPNVTQEDKEDTGDKDKSKNRGRISRAIKDSSETKSESEKEMNEPVQQK